MNDYRNFLAEEQGTGHYDIELTKADVEIEAMKDVIKKHFVKNNHCNCDTGNSYSEIHFYDDDDIEGVSHSIAKALHNANYRKQSNEEEVK